MGKIEELEVKINNIQKQIDNALYELESTKSELSNLKNQNLTVDNTVDKINTYVPSVNNKQNLETIPTIVKTNEEKSSVVNDQHKKNKYNDFEFILGKKIMPILASLLIFFALTFITSLVIPLLGDTVKVFLMFLISIGVTSFSFVKSKEDKNNTFFTGLLACGIGCIYLSILITRIHFEMINDIVMYIMLLLWGIITVFISMKNKQMLFQIIGNIGLFISVCLSIANGKPAYTMPLTLYLLIYEITYLFIFKNTRIQRGFQWISGLLSLLLFEFILIVDAPKEIAFNYTMAIGILLISNLIAYVYLIFKKYQNGEPENAISVFLNSISIFLVYINFFDIINLHGITSLHYLIPFFIIAFIPMVITTLKEGEESANVLSIAFSTLIIFVLIIIRIFDKYDLLGDNDFTKFNIPSEFLYSIILFGLGYIYDKKYIKIPTYFLFGFTTVIAILISANIYTCIFALLISIVLFVLENVFKKSDFLGCFSYILTIIIFATTYFILNGLEYKNIENFSIIFISVSVCLLNFVFHKNQDMHNNNFSNILLNIANSILMFVLCKQLQLDVYTYFTKICLIMTLIAAGCLNLKHHLKNKKEHIYAGLKFVIIIFASLSGLGAPNYLISISVLIFATLCIIIGFKFLPDSKSIRIFGLILSMIAVFKFIVIDISYSEILAHAISLLISGILCFAISAIYNYIEKQNKK